MNTTSSVNINFLEELEAEVTASRKCLERMRDDLYDWTPHPKSMKMGYLAAIVSQMPKWIVSIIKDQEIDFATYEKFEGRTGEEFAAYFDKNMEEARKALSEVKEETLSEPFHLKNAGQVVASSTKMDMLAPCINHLVHHRGQLTVYMRMNEIAIPSLYGPSADEQGF